MSKTFAVTILGFAMLLGGCQGMQSAHTQGSLKNQGFMATFGVYRHCHAGTDVAAMRDDLTHLLLAVEEQESASSSPQPVPDFLKAMIHKQAPRLSADPNAMAASCAISIGQTALVGEQMDLATEMFQNVITNHSEPEYAYYVEQARIGLRQVASAAQFAGNQNGTPTTLRISTVSPAHASRLPVFSAD